MKPFEINNRVSRFFKSSLIKKIICLILTSAIAVLSCLACFYFQLAQKDGFCTLLMLADWLACLILVLVVKLPAKKEKYQRVVCTAFATMCDTKGLKNKKELLARATPVTDKVIPGVAGYTTAKREETKLLNSMLSCEQAFPNVKLGFKTGLRYKSFIDFAIIDSARWGTDNSLSASSRWYRVHKKLMQPTGIAKWVAYLAGWLICSIISILVLCNLFDLNNQAQLIILISLLAITVQLKNLSTCQSYLNKIASVLTDAETPAADANICLAFANSNDYYKSKCVEAGLIQSTQERVLE